MKIKDRVEKRKRKYVYKNHTFMLKGIKYD